MSAPRNPARIVNALTRYECAIIPASGAPIVLGYLGRRTRRAVFETMCAHRDSVLCAIGGLDAELTWNARRSAFVCGSVAIGFTGRTERDAYVGQVAA